MIWLARLKEKISETPGGEAVAKVAKDPLAPLAIPVPLCIPVKKSNPEHHQIKPDLDDTHNHIQEHLAERAAIQEYDGGLTREQAEAEALRNLRVFHYRLTDNPDAWLVLIAPGCDLEQATRTCHNKFGADRVIEVRVYNHSVREIC